MNEVGWVSMSPEQFLQSIRAEAKRLGFELLGATPAVSPTGYQKLVQWIDDGYAGEMRYIPERLAAYEHPNFVLPNAKSVLPLAMNYHTGQPAEQRAGSGRISCYAWSGTDYHDLVHQRLRSLCQYSRQLMPEAAVRGVVDTAPLLEREFAHAAGLGWLAKNTMLINRQLGSWFFLAALLLDFEVPYDSPLTVDHCGTCTACLTACPTNAFPEPGVLDATKCISYLTIEHRSPIALELRGQMDDWILGCDICQQVCPWNRKAPCSTESAFQPRDELNPLSLIELFDLNDQEFRQRFRKTPLWRPRRRGILRNAAIALGNHPAPGAVDALSKGLNDNEPLVRGASAWALARQNLNVVSILEARLEIESDEYVRDEILMAIDETKIQGSAEH